MKDRESVTTNGRAVFYAAMWNDLRQAAMNCGWALGLHGSLNSDMDIMAMPCYKERQLRTTWRLRMFEIKTKIK